MSAPLHAAGSALCALCCFICAAGGIVCLLLGRPEAMLLLAGAPVFGLGAKLFDRQKMRSLFGPELGDRLHETDAGEADCLQRAWDELLSYGQLLLQQTDSLQRKDS